MKDDVLALGVLLKEIATMVAHLSEDAQNLLNALLQKDEAKRPTSLQILHFSAVKAEANKLVSSAEFNEQFHRLLVQKLNYANENTTEV